MSNSSEKYGALAICFSVGLMILFCYGCISFITWNLNPSNWSEPSRFLFVVYTVIWLVIGIRDINKESK